MSRLADILRLRRDRRRWPGARIAADCRLEAGCRVDAGARLRATILRGEAQVDHDCVLDACELQGPCRVMEAARLWRVTLAPFSYIAGQAQVAHTAIGRFSSIATVRCGRGGHPSDRLATSPAFYARATPFGATFAPNDGFDEHLPTTIGHDVWIGAGAFIRDGMRIGDGAIVGAGAVVTRDVPPYAVVGGVPARVIRMRFPDDTIARLLRLAWWHWPADTLRQAQHLLAGADVAALTDWARDKGLPT